MSGTLIAMVYYGLQLLSPNYFYVTACAISALVAISIGSSWTVVGTIGIGFMGIAANMGLNPAIAAGAIISGAYFGDTSSPLSDSANLAAAAAGVDLYPHLRETLLTSSLALAISLAVFFMLGQPGDFDASATRSAASRSRSTSPSAVPAAGRGRRARGVQVPAVHVDLPRRARRRPACRDRRTGTGGRVCRRRAGNCRAWLALFKGVWLALASGYKSTTGIASMDLLASRGGMDSMLNTIWLIITALAFGGVVEKVGRRWSG